MKICIISAIFSAIFFINTYSQTPARKIFPCVAIQCDTLVDTAYQIPRQSLVLDGKPNEIYWKFKKRLRNVSIDNSGYFVGGTSITANPLIYNNKVKFATLWDEDNLYVAVVVKDTQMISSPNWNPTSSTALISDAITVFIDPYLRKADTISRNGRSAFGKNNENYFIYTYGNEGVAKQFYQPWNRIADIKAAVNDTGYTVEFAIPWNLIDADTNNQNNLLGKPEIGRKLGFDLANDDDDNFPGDTVQQRDYQLTWNNKCDTANILRAISYGILMLGDTDSSTTAAALKNNIVEGPGYSCEPFTATYTFSPMIPGIEYRWNVHPVRDVQILGNFSSGYATGSSITVRFLKKGPYVINVYPVLPEPNCSGAPKYNLFPTTKGVQIGPVLPKIEGLKAVCPFMNDIPYRLTNTFSGYSYQWSGDGFTAIDKQSGDDRKVLVDWSFENFSAFLKVGTTGADGCKATEFAYLPVLINSFEESKIMGDTAICVNLNKRAEFSIEPIESATIGWTVTGLNILNGQGSPILSTEYSGQQATLYVEQTVNYGTNQKCVSKGYKSIKTPDKINFDFQKISVLENDESKVEMNWTAKGMYVQSKTDVFRSLDNSNFIRYSILTPQNLAFTDQNAPTDKGNIYYYLTGYNNCYTEERSNTIQPIHLSLDNTNSNILKLKWNDYQLCKNGIDHYEIYKSVNEGPLERFTTTTNNYYDMPREGITHTFRIKAICSTIAGSTIPLVSFSNSVSEQKEDPLISYDVITPNGDTKNEAFVIENLLNYPKKQLIVYNRWGKRVFQSDDYRNNWRPDDLPDGLYYYTVKYGITTPNKEINGWVTILK